MLQISEDRYWDEISAAERLKEYRAQQEGFMGISFGTISAFGENGAVIHYQPVLETNKQITNTSLYLLDSGGQYKGERHDMGGGKVRNNMGYRVYPVLYMRLSVLEISSPEMH